MVADALTVQPIRWPRKYRTLGVDVSATTYGELVEVLTEAATRRQPAIVDFMPVSNLTVAADDAGFRAKLNAFDVVCPDGQPIRWCLNHFHGLRLRSTVCGTSATLRLCESAARHGIGVYLYGSTPDTLDKLQANLLARIPELKIAGVESPPFAPLTAAERDAVIARINSSGAGLVFIGIGSPKQEHFAWEQKAHIRAVQLCVGAAFDFIAGTRRRAPEAWQRLGLEWLHRVWSEPRRLGRRYLVSNSRFVSLLVPALLWQTVKRHRA
jgi:exopolysaccharide biosynthesis WecB/TagA/CpsF family protein